MNISILNNNKAEFIGQIVDIFEDYLEEKGIDIPNKDRDSEINSLVEEDISSEDESITSFAYIYGDDYDEIGGEVEYGLETNLSINELIDNIYEAFIRVTNKNANVSIPDIDNTMLKNSVRKIFVKWKLTD